MNKSLFTSLSLTIFVILRYKTQSVMQVYDFPNDKYFILSDITYYDLNTKFALFMKSRYLGESTQNFRPVVNGSIFGRDRRSFIILPVRLNNPNCEKSLNVIFKIDTGVQKSTISRQVTDALYDACPERTKVYDETYDLRINEQPSTVTQTILPLQLFNTLGMDFLSNENIELIIDYKTFKRSTVEMKFRIS